MLNENLNFEVYVETLKNSQWFEDSKTIESKRLDLPFEEIMLDDWGEEKKLILCNEVDGKSIGYWDEVRQVERWVYFDSEGNFKKFEVYSPTGSVEKKVANPTFEVINEFLWMA